MTAEGWRREVIDATGLAVDVYEGWERVPRDDGFDLRSSAGTVAFVRVGPGATIQAFLPGLSDFVTTATVTADERLRLAGGVGRQVTVAVRRPPMRVYRDDPIHGPVDEERAEQGATVVLVEPELAQGRALVGFRLPDEEAAALDRPVAERFLRSLGPG